MAGLLPLRMIRGLKTVSETAKRLHQVDPDLKVVPGYVRRHGATEQEWLASTGVTCSVCGKEVQRSRDGMCIPCWENRNEFEIRDKAGVLKLLPESIIMSIVHPSRKGNT